MRETVPRLALRAEIAGRISFRGCQGHAGAVDGARRAPAARLQGPGEAQFLDVLDDIAETGRTRAEDLLDRYDGDWNGDVTRVFRDFAF